MTRAAAVVVAAAIVLALPCVAGAATGRQVRALATQARTSPAALRQLRAIRRVDGRPADLARLLRTNRRAALEERLRVLAAAPATASPRFPPQAAARRILVERRFRGSALPRPLHGTLVWIGQRLRPVGRLFHRVAKHLPGGSWTLALVLAALLVLASAVVATRTARGRGQTLLELSTGARREPLADPAALEREADEAEAAGDRARALRLRFRAGLLRLGRARVVPLRASLTSGEARRILRLAEFDELARAHDEVVYGGRDARADDVASAREGWPRVLAAKGVRL